MESSAIFRTQNQVLFSAPVLKSTPPAGDNAPAPSDVVDLNHDGKAGAQEPVLLSPSWDQLKNLAEAKGADVLTQDDVPGGVYVSAPDSAGHAQPFQQVENFDPSARFALDFSTGEFLVYKPNNGQLEPVTTPSGLQYTTLKQGVGPEATPGHMVLVHYTGWLKDGTKFDSSVDRGEPFAFPLGQHKVIAGWDEGVAGMKVGEERRLQIPSKLAYGEHGAGNVIPPNADLTFKVELLGVK